MGAVREGGSHALLTVRPVPPAVPRAYPLVGLGYLPSMESTPKTVDAPEPPAPGGRPGCASVVGGVALVLIGVPMLVCPGPGIASIAAGLGMIAVGLGLRRTGGGP